MSWAATTASVESEALPCTPEPSQLSLIPQLSHLTSTGFATAEPRSQEGREERSPSFAD